jgi:hypothetical protein
MPCVYISTFDRGTARDRMAPLLPAEAIASVRLQNRVKDCGPWVRTPAHSQLLC